MFDKKKGAFLTGILILVVSAVGMEWKTKGGIECVAAAAHLESTVHAGAADEPDMTEDETLLNKLDISDEKKVQAKEEYSIRDPKEWKDSWAMSAKETDSETLQSRYEGLFSEIALTKDSISSRLQAQLSEGAKNSTLAQGADVCVRESNPVTQSQDQQSPGQEVSYMDEAAAQAAQEAEKAKIAQQEQEAARQAAAKEQEALEAAAALAAQEAEEAMAQPVNPYGQIALSGEDYTALERIVQAEAGGEDSQGKILVAQVVLNRVLDDNFGDTAEGVILEKIGGSAQFSPTVDGRYYSVDVTQESKDAVYAAVNGEDISQGALYFSARSKANPNDMRWFDRNLKWLFQYGGHEFYTLP